MMGWMKAAPLLLLGVMLLWTNWQRMTQQEQLIEQQQHIRLADTQIASLTESLMTKVRELDELQQQADADQQAYLTLQQQTAAAHDQLRQRNQQLEKLKRENQQLREWADTALPADIIRLHQHTTITGSAAYRQLPETEALPASGAATAE
ncbi:Rz-like lysis system protein LysB [Escherichia coli]|uniref:Holin n=2 Tax=Escherichia coli TaxID=562 RepID=A0A2K3TWF2_ECOLX|nr:MULTISPECIES: Rz-like lysis system protein LysB [Escherichia]EGI4719163.1 holin [Escherichia coli]EGO5044322.1 holin [Escherichia coli]EGO6115195.1 holin [Escherichia coli]EGO6708224.1 holin [Escherichia coli]EGO6740628.1 holin [Escherichia coli]